MIYPPTPKRVPDTSGYAESPIQGIIDPPINPPLDEMYVNPSSVALAVVLSTGFLQLRHMEWIFILAYRVPFSHCVDT